MLGARDRQRLLQIYNASFILSPLEPHGTSYTNARDL